MVFTLLKQLYHLFSFQLKLVLAIIILLSNYFYSLSPLVDDIQFVASIKFLILAIYGLKGALAPYLIGLCSKYIPEENLDDNILELSNRMGTTIKSVKTINYHSAFVWNKKTLFLGNEAKSVLSTKELEAVVAHEFSHEIRSRTHDRYLVLGAIFALLIIIPIAWNYQIDTSFFIRISNVVAVAFVSFPIWWLRELDCDKTAILYVEGNYLATALRKIITKSPATFYYTHPSVNYRINRIEN